MSEIFELFKKITQRNELKVKSTNRNKTRKKFLDLIVSIFLVESDSEDIKKDFMSLRTTIKQ